MLFTVMICSVVVFLIIAILAVVDPDCKISRYLHLEDEFVFIMEFYAGIISLIVFIVSVLILVFYKLFL